METNGGKEASSQTSLQMSDQIVIVRELISNDAKQAPSSPIFPKTHQKPNSSDQSKPETEEDDDDCTPCFQTLSDYFKLSFIVQIYIAAGVVSFYLIRHQISGKKTNSVLDAFYYTVILYTSVGYGDLTPDTTLAILLATLFAILGILLTGTMISLLADMFLKTQQSLVEALESEKVESNVMIKKCLVQLLGFYLVVHMAVGIPVMISVENLDFTHALYCVNATLISVGSDNCFSTKSGRIFALFWILNGMMIITFMLFTFTELYTQRRRRSLVKKALERKTTPADLDAADLDGDGSLVLAEYILYMLNEMEKLKQKDMKPIIEEYHRLNIRGLVTSDAHKNTVESDGRNQASSIEPPQPSFRTIPIPSSDRKRKTVEYFPWLHTSYDLWKIIIILSIYLGAGTTCFYLVRHQISGKKTNNIVDALFFTLVITTSVGYGDLSPDGNLAMLLASLFSLVGMFLLALVLSMGAYILVKQQLHKIGPKTTAIVQKRKESNIVGKKIVMIVILFLVHMVVGTAILISIEDLDFIHSFYCITVTITSASSDKCFSTKHGRVFALFWILLGTIYKGHVLFTFTELYTQRTQRHLVKKTITTTREDLEAADLDGDGVVVPAEYILFKLREKGMFREEDVAPIIEKFKSLDIDNTGRLALT